MDNTPLNENLVKLQDELKAVKPADVPSQEAINKLGGNIHTFLHFSEKEGPPALHFSLKESLEDSLEYFETSHPVITDLITRLIQALGDMGI
jgi:hypothetical protein